MRLRQIEEEFGGAVRIAWRSFLLRPHRTPRPDRERFRRYTRSWLRAAEDEPGASFRVWEGDANPPSHSVPAHRLAKAAEALGASAGRRVRERLFRAYFAENRDISDPDTLRALWQETGLPLEELARSHADEIERVVRAEHEEALQLGVTGVPAVRLEDSEFVLLGAQPLANYRRWLQRSRARSCS